MRDSQRNPSETYPMLEPKIFAKITLKSVNKNLVVLPGDQVALKFTSAQSYNHGLRIAPDIQAGATSQPLPEHFRRRYIDGSKVVLPCNDQKVADTVTCNDYVVFCFSPQDRITLSVQGKGNSYLVDQTCGEFLTGERDWNQVQAMLENDV